jgi:hypothetical protein
MDQKPENEAGPGSVELFHSYEYEALRRKLLMDDAEKKASGVKRSRKKQEAAEKDALRTLQEAAWMLAGPEDPNWEAWQRQLQKEAAEKKASAKKKGPKAKEEAHRLVEELVRQMRHI